MIIENTINIKKSYQHSRLHYLGLYHQRKINHFHPNHQTTKHMTGFKEETNYKGW